MDFLDSRYIHTAKNNPTTTTAAAIILTDHAFLSKIKNFFHTYYYLFVRIIRI